MFQIRHCKPFFGLSSDVNPNLGEGRGCNFTPPTRPMLAVGFLSNSETLKAVTLTFCSIQ